ncbi:MAG TPA: hypothetical protein VEL31_10365 [Ktedonobacteraceae bacterium]|nr:hypothetical protein [Ktedonobacteraceae bacterium]
MTDPSSSKTSLPDNRLDQNGICARALSPLFRLKKKKVKTLFADLHPITPTRTVESTRLTQRSTTDRNDGTPPRLLSVVDLASRCQPMPVGGRWSKKPTPVCNGEDMLT